MREIPVFKAELADGLGDAVAKQGSIAYCAVAQISSPFVLADKVKAHLRATAENADQPDLHYLKTLLVSTGWNLNDDVFDTQEVLVAKATPEGKPWNYEHECSDIIGHITGCHPVDDEGGPVDQSAATDALPAKYHVLTSGVLYKVWPEPKLQERMDRLIAEIGEAKWFVSMECLFTGFDYAVIKKDGTHSVIARNSETAFLTKHLRAYGGTGAYKDYKIGRLLRNITFSGKGLVRNPANPRSVIFQNTQAFLSNLGYSSLTTENPEKSMAEDNLRQELNELKAEKAKLEVALRENDTKALTAAKAKVEGDLAVAQKNLDEAKANVETLTKAVEAAKAEADTAKKAATEAEAKATATEAKLAELDAKAKREARITLASTKLNYDRPKAEKLADKLAALTDEAFASDVDERAAELAEARKAAETAKAGQGEPAEVVLEGATPAKEPVLAAVAKPDEKAEKVRQQIANHMTAALQSGRKRTRK